MFQLPFPWDGIIGIGFGVYQIIQGLILATIRQSTCSNIFDMILAVVSLIGGLVYVAFWYVPIDLYLGQASSLMQGIWYGLVVSGSVCVITNTIIIVYTIRPFLLWRKLSTGYDEEGKKKDKAKAGL